MTLDSENIELHFEIVYLLVDHVERVERGPDELKGPIQSVSVSSASVENVGTQSYSPESIETNDSVSQHHQSQIKIFRL